eukprot:COSAG01_NODE_2993_length_6743_cov_9.073299_1_plen_60_part_00
MLAQQRPGVCGPLLIATAVLALAIMFSRYPHARTWWPMAAHESDSALEQARAAGEPSVG